MTFNREVQYAIIRHLQEHTEAKSVHWQRDRLNIDGLEKPFIVVWAIQSETEVIATGRTDYNDVYRYQITLRGRTEDDLEMFKQSVISALRKPVPMYVLGDSPIPAGRSFVVDIDTVVSMPSEDLSREVDLHRAHIDVYVDTFFDTATDSFTQ